MVPAHITSHLNSCRVLKKGSFSSFSSKHNSQSDFFENKSAHVTTVPKTKISFSTSLRVKTSQKPTWHGPHYPTGSSACCQLLSSSLTKLHPHQPIACPQMLHEHSSFLDLKFSVPEKCKEPLSLCFKAVSCTNEKLCGMKGSWCVCLTDGQKCERLCRIFSTGTYPFLTSPDDIHCTILH